MYANLAAYLQEELEVFAAEFIQNRAAALRSRGASATDQLAKSLAYEVRAQSVDAAAQLLIAFEEHGRFIDMKNLQPGEAGADYIANLIRWIDAKGLREKFIRSYVRKRGLKKPPERVMTYIAFGIARKRFNGKYRRRRWYNKAKSAQITELYDTVLAGMPDVIFEELKNGFKDRQGGGVRSR